jgi:hypothetical protein
MSSNSQQDGFSRNPNSKSKLFFGLCDMRTATVSLNIINIIFTVIVALILCFMYAFDNGPYRLQAVSAVLFGAIAVSCVSGLGLYSAMNWRLDGMYATTVAFVLILVVRILKIDIIDALVTGVLLYPHVIFTMEMRSGIMTPETFDGEEYVTEGGRDFVEMAHAYISPNDTMVSTPGSPETSQQPYVSA